MKIRKVISLLLIASFICTVSFAATPGRDLGHDAGDVAGNNSSRYDWDAHKTFRLVRYMPAGGSSISATLVADSIVIWDCTSDDGVTVTTTTTSPDSAVAGIIVQQALTAKVLGNTAKQDYAKRNWTWLQVYGLAEVRVNATNNVVSGDAMGTSATAGEADIFVASATESGKNGNAGFFYDASAAAGDDVKCFVRCE